MNVFVAGRKNGLDSIRVDRIRSCFVSCRIMPEKLSFGESGTEAVASTVVPRAKTNIETIKQEHPFGCILYDLDSDRSDRDSPIFYPLSFFC